MTNLSLKNIKNNIVGPHKNRWPQGGPQKGAQRPIGGAIEVAKVGTKTSKKVNLPAPLRGSAGRPAQRGILTEFQNRFKAKQVIKHYYGSLSENYLRSKILAPRMGAHGVVCELEKRLDVLVFRFGFASSVLEARSFIKSGLVKINDKLAHTHSYSKPVNVGSKISILTPPVGAPKGRVQGARLAYLAKIKHLKFNLLKTPTHLAPGAPAHPPKGGPLRDSVGVSE